MPVTGNTNGIAFTFYGLNNPTFEADDALSENINCFEDFLPNGCTGWTSFENVFTVNTINDPFGPVSHDVGGFQSMQQYGPFVFSTGSVAEQVDNTVVAGSTYTATVYAMNWNGDNFNNVFLLQIFALDSGGNNISGGGEFDPVSQVVAAAPALGAGADYVLHGTDGGNDFDWTQMMVSAVMPAGTAATRIQLIHILVESTPDDGAIFLDDASLTVTVPIAIDIKPGSDPVNPVNPESKGVIPVAVLGSMDFDATQVDFSTVEFGPGKASPVHDGHVENVNGDGFDDMVFHFNTQDTGITCGDTEATLLGETFGGDVFTGTDSVKTAGCK